MPRQARPWGRLTAEQQALAAKWIGLAYQFANAMHRRAPWLDRDDLCGAAGLGLCRAAGRWDPARGVAFSSYAKRAILNALQAERWAYDAGGLGAMVSAIRNGTVGPDRAKVMQLIEGVA